MLAGHRWGLGVGSSHGSCRAFILGRGLKTQARAEPEVQRLPRGADGGGPALTEASDTISHNVYYVQRILARLPPGRGVRWLGSLDLLTQVLLKAPVSFGCPAWLRQEYLHLWPHATNTASRPILDRSDVLGPAFPLRFRCLQGFGPHAKLLSRCLGSIGSPKPGVPLLGEP